MYELSNMNILYKYDIFGFIIYMYGCLVKIYVVYEYRFFVLIIDFIKGYDR